MSPAGTFVASKAAEAVADRLPFALQDPAFVQPLNWIFTHATRQLARTPMLEPEDLVQEAWLALLEPPRTPEADPCLEAVRAVQRRLRRAVRARTVATEALETEDGVLHDMPDPSADPTRWDAPLLATPLLDGLSPDQARALMLRSEGYSGREIGARLGCTEGRARRLARSACRRAAAFAGAEP